MQLQALSPIVHFCAVNQFSNGINVPTRVLLDYELVLCEQGHLLLTVDRERELPCGPGDVILLRPGQPNRWQSSDKTLVHTYVHFDLVCLEDSDQVFISFQDQNDLSSQALSLIRSDLLPEWGISVPTVFHASTPLYYQGLLKEILHHHVSNSVQDQLICKARMIELLGAIFAPFCSQTDSKRSRDTLLISVKSYIDNNTSRQLHMDELAEYFHISKYHLTRMFTSRFGVSAIQYYNAVRMEKACSLLREGYGVGETAHLLGFSDVYSFSHFFKKHYGEPPSNLSI